jgi:hypothetical protein
MNKQTLNSINLGINNNSITINIKTNSKVIIINITKKIHLLKILLHFYNKIIKVRISLMEILSKKNHSLKTNKIINIVGIKIKCINRGVRIIIRIINNTNSRVFQKIVRMLIKNIMATNIINKMNMMKCSAENH